MKFALMRCCPTNHLLAQYETSTNAVLERLGIEAVDIREFNCCGYPVRNYNFMAFVLSSARNLALAEKENLDVLTACSCCYGSLKHVDHLLKNDSTVRDEVNSKLNKEGLKFGGSVETKHFLSVLFHDVGLENIKEKLVKTFDGLKIATHYGCHQLRPEKIVQFDNPMNPSIFDQLVELTGAQSINWQAKLDCCGAPLWGVNDELSLDLTENKLKSARQSGADYLCVTCPYCHMQFDRVQGMLISQRGGENQLPALLYHQLLGLCLGLNEETLGLTRNLLPASNLMDFTSHAENRGIIQ